MLKQWKLYNTVPDVADFAAELGITELSARILWHRGIRTMPEAEQFLHPEKQPFHDPLLMKDMDKAVARICRAIEQGEKIVVYGDYDVDGMSATSLMIHNLKALGAVADFHIPDRAAEGYGFNLPALQKIAAEGAGLLVSVDCGIASAADVAAMKDRLDIIVTDHHLPGDVLPDALAVVNPHRADCPYPDKSLCGAGVAFKLCQALWKEMRGETYARDLEIVALGTVADVVPLTGENRRIVKEGLKAMRDSSFPGIRALIEVADIRDGELNTGHIGFRLAPRLNAAGRIGSGEKGVRLLLSESDEEAGRLAKELDALNSRRQAIEQEILQRAESELAGKDPDNLPAIVVAGENWNPGVIGIVASRLVDRYYKPAVVMSIQPDGLCKGSCRSIDSLNMYETLKLCREHIVQFGGHAQAAGLTVRQEELEAFRQSFAEACAASLSDADYIPKVAVEFELAPEDITVSFVEELALFEPYGMGNPKPLFGWRNIRGTGAAAIGAQKQHLRFQVGRPSTPIHALFWNKSEYAGIVNAEAVDMVYSPAINEWQGKKSIQCMVDTLSPADKEKVFPERGILVEIYKFLYGIQQQEGRIPYTAAELALNFSQLKAHISLYTMRTGLRIFQELSLLRLNLEENTYYLLKASGRIELDHSPTFRRHR